MDNLGKILQFRNGRKRPITIGDFPVYGGNGILGYANDFNMQKGIIIGRVGAYCGSVFLSETECWVSDNAIMALPLDDSDFLFSYYLLKWLELNKRHIGTGQPLITQEILNRIEVDLPTPDKREKIGSILYCLDKRIQNNSAINDNLAA